MNYSLLLTLILYIYIYKVDESELTLIIRNYKDDTEH